MTPEQVAWVAGLIEGEGYIQIRKEAHSVRINVAMTDEDVVRRLQAFTGVGAVYAWTKKTKGGKNVWTWSVGHRAEVRPLLMEIAPWMGVRRGAVLRTALEWLESAANRGPRARGRVEEVLPA